MYLYSRTFQPIHRGCAVLRYIGSGGGGYALQTVMLR